MDDLLNTHIHWLTLVFIYLESIFLFIQINDLLRYPKERKQLWYLLLLCLLICFNLALGFFPNASFRLSLKAQFMLADGIAYVLGSYIAFYIYKAFDLDRLKFYATYGVLIFEILPYLIFEVLLYEQNDRLWPDRQWGVIIPAAYGLVVLVVILRAIIQKHRGNSDWGQYKEALAVWLAILPWEAMCYFAFHPVVQWLQVLMANLGWVVITLFMIIKFIRRVRRESRLLLQSDSTSGPSLDFFENCQKYGLSKTETEVAVLVRRGWTNQAIADYLYRSLETIKTHVKNCLKKTGATTRSELIHILEHGYVQPL
jgi:DNA-binding CsgD family transcriptional regulator/large-conductance mechanosensitive channel